MINYTRNGWEALTQKKVTIWYFLIFPHIKNALQIFNAKFRKTSMSITCDNTVICTSFYFYANLNFICPPLRIIDMLLKYTENLNRFELILLLIRKEYCVNLKAFEVTN